MLSELVIEVVTSFIMPSELVYLCDVHTDSDR